LSEAVKRLQVLKTSPAARNHKNLDILGMGIEPLDRCHNIFNGL